MTLPHSAVACALSFESPSALARRGEPVVWGVPMPRGLFRTGAALSVDRATPAGSVTQADVLDRWSDGSARWVLGTFRVSTHDPVTSDVLPSITLVPSARTPDDTGPSMVTRLSDGFRVDTGPLQVTLAHGGRWPVQAMTRDGRSVCDAVASGLAITAHDGRDLGVTIDHVEIEREGAGHVLVRARGQRIEGGRPLVYVEWLLTFFAGLPVVQAAVTIRNPRKAEHPGGHWELGDAGSLLIDDATFHLRLAAAAPADAGACSDTPAAALGPVPLPFTLYQESSGGVRWNGTNHVNREGRVPQTLRGYRRSDRDGEAGLRATPIVQASSAAGTVTLATRHFWQNCPRRVGVDAQGLTYGFFPGEFPDAHELQGGEQRTHEFALAFGDDGVTDVPLAWWREPLVPVLDPAWVAATGAVAHVVPEALDPHPAYVALARQAIDGSDTFEAKRERLDEYGWRHFGDIYGDHEAVKHAGPDPLVSHYNNQYDPVFGFAVQFLRSGDTRWWPHCDQLASHVVDVDIYHTTEDKAAYNNGLFWHTVHYIDAGKATHRTYPRAPGSHGGGPASEQNYTTGLMTHWFLTGNPASRDTAVALGQFVIDIDDGSKTPFRWLDGGYTGLATASASEHYHGPGRGSGNSLNALVDAHRLTGDAKYLAKADQVMRRAVHPTQDIAALDLLDVERKWFYTMFLQSLGRYLAHMAELGRLDDSYAYGRASLLHFARWMAEHERPYLERPEVLEFPTETWPAQDIRKSEVFAWAALHASGDERTRLVARADFFFRYAVDTLTAHPRKALARPVVLLLAHGWRHAWLLANPDAAEPTPVSPSTSWPAQTPFVPQKARAIRRAKLLALAGGATALLLVAVAMAAVLR